MHSPRHPVEGPALLRFAQALSASRSLAELDRVFVTGFRQLFDIPIYGFNVCEPGSLRMEHNVAPSVSDVFVARYNSELWDDDPLRSTANRTLRPVYNLGLMSAQEWKESRAYRRVFSLHRMHHVIEAPMIGATGLVGNFHMATSDPQHDFGAMDFKLAEALGGVIAVTIDGIRATTTLAQERDELACALALTGTAVVVSDPAASELRLNDAAQRLLADVVDADEHLHRLLVRPPTNLNEGFSRRLEVELTTGESALLQARSGVPRQRHEALVTVLELHREHPSISLGMLTALTPREAEVATLVTAGLADREIAAEIGLSHHTVSQYVKRVYRKLGVDSRVGLTRLLLGVDRDRGKR